MTLNRIASLDGLRGLAIVAVILTHIPSHQIETVTPFFLKPLLSIPFGNGGLGVATLFILTGFLMASIYPNPQSILFFWSKRFARLLPLFLVMVTSLSIIRSNPTLLPLIKISIVFGITLFARLLWEVGLKMSSKIPLGKILTIGWLGFQLAMALWYIFVLLKVPSSVFYLVWSPLHQSIATALINASLTLPFGQYIGQIDGVYWSLVTEMFFYLIYPLIFVPILWYSKKFSLRFKTILLLTSVPACFGIELISKRLLGFEIMSLHLMIYFIAGTVIGSNLVWFQTSIKRYCGVLLHPIGTLALLFVVIYGKRFMYPHLSSFYEDVPALVSVFPIGLMLIVATISQSKLNQWLSNATMVFLGKISFSLYLTHSFIIHIVEEYFSKQTALSEFLIIIVSLVSSIIFSTVTYWLIEKPYYDLKRKKTNQQADQKITMRNYITSAISVTSLIIFAMYLAVKAPVSLFAQATAEVDYSLNLFLKGEEAQEISTNPYSVSFVSKENGLGMVTTHIRGRSKDSSVGYPSIPPQLVITLLDDNMQKIASSNYQANNLYEDSNHPLGFPIITDSKNKKYTVTYQLDQPDPSTSIYIINAGTVIKPIYFFNKTSLFHQPLEMLTFINSKIVEPFTIPMFWLISLYTFPFLGILWLGVNKK